MHDEQKKKGETVSNQKAAVSWENKMRGKLYSNWQKDTTCLADWANQYLSYSEKMYVIKT